MSRIKTAAPHQKIYKASNPRITVGERHPQSKPAKKINPFAKNKKTYLT